MLRAELSDCDDSDRLDSCEIADGTLVDTDGDGVPDMCPAFDLNGDDAIDAADIAQLLSQWGSCPEAPKACPADFNDDGLVDGGDLGALLSESGG